MNLGGAALSTIAVAALLGVGASARAADGGPAPATAAAAASSARPLRITADNSATLVPLGINAAGAFVYAVFVDASEAPASGDVVALDLHTDKVIEVRPLAACWKNPDRPDTDGAVCNRAVLGAFLAAHGVDDGAGLEVVTGGVIGAGDGARRFFVKRLTSSEDEHRAQVLMSAPGRGQKVVSSFKWSQSPSTREADPDVVALVVSPFERRVAVVVRLRPPEFEGATYAQVRVFGASLDERLAPAPAASMP